MALHCVVARKLLENPEVIAQARDNLARWRAPAVELEPAYIAEWQRILEGRPEEIARFLASPSEEATRLRSCSPFTNVLTAQERARIYEDFHDPSKVL